LQDVSFEIKPGEVVGIIGRNGSGKSTLLKILSRITEPTRGRALLYGRVGSLLEVGTGFHPELTGRENIALSGSIMGMHRHEIARHFDEIVAFAGIDEFIDTPVKRYSSGMYVRLAFAVAAHLNTDILLVDEVLAVGDAEFQNKCLQKMESVATGEGRTILFVSHNMAALNKLTTRSLLFESGQITMQGDTGEVIRYYIASTNQVAETGVRDLTQMEARRGVGKKIKQNIIFSRIALENHGRQITSLFKHNDSMIINVRFLSRIVTTGNTEIVLMILTLDDVILFTCGSGKLIGIQKGNYEIQITIPRIPLSVGTYKIKAFIHRFDWEDVIPEALRFQIEPHDAKQLGQLAMLNPSFLGVMQVENRCSQVQFISD
jgi:lipopolysaccharide transport system ATP-binding protein